MELGTGSQQARPNINLACGRISKAQIVVDRVGCFRRLLDAQRIHRRVGDCGVGTDQVSRRLWRLAGLPGWASMATLTVAIIWLGLLWVASKRSQSTRPALAALLENLSGGLKNWAASLFSMCLVMLGATFLAPAGHLQTALLCGWLCICLALCSHSVGNLAEGVIDYKFRHRA